MAVITEETRTAARELHTAHAEAERQLHLATLSYAYGNGTGQAKREALEKVNAIASEMLALHGLTIQEWWSLNRAERNRYWGF